MRTHDVGTTPQEYTLRRAKAPGCYQVRSTSDGDHPENHWLKLAMGFAVEPMEQARDSQVDAAAPPVDAVSGAVACIRQVPTRRASPLRPLRPLRRLPACLQVGAHAHRMG